MTQQGSTLGDGAPDLTIAAVRFEHRRDTLGMGEAQPRLSWIVGTKAAGWRQAGYEIEAYGSDDELREQTGRVESDHSVLVSWPFTPLSSRERLTVRVRAWGVDGRPSAWSVLYPVEAGLLHADDWTARFVTPNWEEDTTRPQPCPLLRREFDVHAGVTRARLYVTALGVYEAQLNGTSVGDHVLAPGWTSYDHRLQYQTFDVTGLLHEGRNALGAMLGDGWYRGRLGFNGGRRNIYGDRLALLAQLEIDYADGTTERIVTDETWHAARGPILASDIYDGETYDARMERPGWSAPGYDDHDWGGVRQQSRDLATLVAPSGPPVRRTELVAPVAITTSPTGRTIVDFGQNLVGRLRLTLHGQAGQMVTLRHAEVLENGELCTRPLRTAQATDRYTLRAMGCLSIPTDCPQRDERLGWTGDIQVFAPTASFLYDASGFLTSWLADLAAEQDAAEGIVPFVVPNIVLAPPVPAAAWGDAAVIVPWVLYQRYGDAVVLAAQFESMRAWVDLVSKLASEGRLWNWGFQFGDWLDPSAPPDKPGDARTDPHVVATAYFARSAELLGQAAGVLGRTEEEAHYLQLAAQVREAFNAEYVTPAGRVLSDAETAYALALQFGLLRDAEQRRHAGERLAALVRESGYHIGTGFVGTPLVCDALCSVGEVDAAFHLLTQRECPSWLYPVTMGATTIWERWDSLRPDGSVNPGQMTSFNHYALGAVADWLHRTVGGLAPAVPGYRHLDVRPHPGGGLTHARARHITPYGLAESAWRIEAGQIEVVVVVPPNATASITLPGGNAPPLEVGSGTHRWSYPYQVKSAHHPRSLDSTISEFLDDPQAWTTVVTTMRRYMPD
ncbi:MAG: alpha-L-rhamnosidase, partial [Chloroflexi bacterium]